MYDYLARSQARNWPYSASRRGRVLGVQQDTLRLALALRPRGYGEGIGNLFLQELVKVNVSQILRTKLVKAPRPPRRTC